jgi:hypothetical protein
MTEFFKTFDTKKHKPSYNFHKKKKSVTPVELLVDNPQIVIASVGEATPYLKTKLPDINGIEYDVIFFLTESSEFLIRSNDIKSFSQVSISGRLFDYVQGVGLTLRDCEIQNYTA